MKASRPYTSREIEQHFSTSNKIQKHRDSTNNHSADKDSDCESDDDKYSSHSSHHTASIGNVSHRHSAETNPTKPTHQTPGRQAAKDPSIVHNNHHSANLTTILGLWMLLDGIGLAIITTATILEGYELWISFFNHYWTLNTGSITLWFTGRTCQIIGLLFLIGYASSFQLFPEVERFGMFLLTLGPIINISACCLFQLSSDPMGFFNLQWFSSESMELIGITILDISMIDMEEIYVLIFEILGFIILCGAAMLQFDYHTKLLIPYFFGQQVPNISLKMDNVHMSECFGLMMLIIVAIGQYRIKVYKHQLEKEQGQHFQFHQQLQQQQQQQGPTLPNSSSSSHLLLSSSSSHQPANSTSHSKQTHHEYHHQRKQQQPQQQQHHHPQHQFGVLLV
jgi:hypothetical protein